MDGRNQTVVTEFVLAGFSNNVYTCILFFVALLLMYILTVFGNVFVIGTVIVTPKLHLPMYFFLCNLSFLDLCYSSSNLPKAMKDIFSRKRTISVTGCLLQMNTGVFLGGTESFLLAVMAYDRYVAVCLPLHYTIIMNWKFCRNLTIIMWSASFLILTVPNNLSPMVFCKNDKLDHFVCEILAVLHLACGNLSSLKVTILVVSFITLIVPLTFIIVSYILIILAVLKIRSNNTRSRAFSTCVSHLIVVFMYYGATITMYTGRRKSFSSSVKYISLLYGIMTPMLNPMIYCLRNKDVRAAFQLILTKYSLQASK